jgi:hypothetical protein
MVPLIRHSSISLMVLRRSSARLVTHVGYYICSIVIATTIAALPELNSKVFFKKKLSKIGLLVKAKYCY